MITIGMIIGITTFLWFLMNRLNTPSTDDDDQSEYPGPDETIAGTNTVIEGERKSDTLGVMFQTLSALGCQPTKNEMAHCQSVISMDRLPYISE